MNLQQLPSGTNRGTAWVALWEGGLRQSGGRRFGVEGGVNRPESHVLPSSELLPLYGEPERRILALNH